MPLDWTGSGSGCERKAKPRPANLLTSSLVWRARLFTPAPTSTSLPAPPRGHPSLYFHSGSSQDIRERCIPSLPVCLPFSLVRPHPHSFPSRLPSFPAPLSAVHSREMARRGAAAWRGGADRADRPPLISLRPAASACRLEPRHAPPCSGRGRLCSASAPRRRAVAGARGWVGAYRYRHHRAGEPAPCLSPCVAQRSPAAAAPLDGSEQASPSVAEVPGTSAPGLGFSYGGR